MDRTIEIREIVDRETRAWDTQDTELLLSIFHPDMVWPWPPTGKDHDPASWVFVLGKFDHARWKVFYDTFFQVHSLVHNRRETKRILISNEGDAALAVVDIDTTWKDADGAISHWSGRVSKGYALVDGEWKLTMHTGVLDY